MTKKIVLRLGDNTPEFRNDFRDFFEKTPWLTQFKLLEGPDGAWFLEMLLDSTTEEVN